jgi:hypothetical protein
MFLTSCFFCEEVLFNLITNEFRETLNVQTVDTYEKREGRGRGHLIYCQKFQKNLVIKMQYNAKTGDPRFFHNLTYPLKRI